MAKAARYGMMLWLLLIATSCQETTDRSGGTDKVHPQSVSRTVLSVETIDESGLKKLIAERNGRILLLNIWATWCAPCVAEFPELVRLSQTYDTTKVEVVAISADDSDEVDTKIIPFLRKMNVPFRVYVAQFKHQEDFIDAVNRSWSGALPASLIYDARGRQQLFHVGQQSYEDFKKQVDKVKGGL